MLSSTVSRPERRRLVPDRPSYTGRARAQLVFSAGNTLLPQPVLGADAFLGGPLHPWHNECDLNKRANGPLDLRCVWGHSPLALVVVLIF